MHIRTTLAARSRLSAARSVPLQLTVRRYSSTSPKRAANRIYDATVRSEEELENLILLSASSRVPLITLWGAKWCSSCKIVTPLIRDLVRSGVGEKEGSVSFAEVEIDAPTLGPLALRYAINSMPTLLAFDRQEAQLETRVTNVDELKDKAFLVRWIEGEASRHGSGGAGGGLLSSLFGR